MFVGVEKTSIIVLPVVSLLMLRLLMAESSQRGVRTKAQARTAMA
jgi:hypothetical protein